MMMMMMMIVIVKEIIIIIIVIVPMITLVYSYNPGSIWFSRHNGPTCCILFIMYWLWNYTYTLMKCGQSLWNCFAPYYKILQWWRRDRTVSSIIFSVFGSLRSFLIFRTEYIYIYIYQNWYCCTIEQHGIKAICGIENHALVCWWIVIWANRVITVLDWYI